MNLNFFPFFQNNLNEISSKTEELCYFSSNRRESFLLEVEIAGIFSTNLWIQNNMDISSVDELKLRVSLFEDILKDPRYLKGIEYFKKVGESVFYQETEISMEDINDSFLKGVYYIEDLLEDNKIKKLEEKCHFQLFSNHIDYESDKISLYKMILANEECLKRLKEFIKEIEKEDIYKIL